MESLVWLLICCHHEVRIQETLRSFLRMNNEGSSVFTDLGQILGQATCKFCGFNTTGEMK